MSDVPRARLADTFAEVEDALQSRWPETRLEPSLDRIRAFTELLGDPQRGYPVIHLTGTNGKTSTSRMIDTLLRALDLRTGRFTSPHLERLNERISIDGEPAGVTPVAVDHARLLGDSPDVIALEKAGIIKPGAMAVLAEQLPGPAEVLLRRCAEVGATPIREGLEFGVLTRVAAVGGQLLTLKGLGA